MARGAADGVRTRGPQIGSLMLCRLSYRRIYRNEDGGEVFRSFLAPITSPIHIISQFPPKRTILKESGGILSFVAASVRLRGALV